MHVPTLLSGAEKPWVPTIAKERPCQIVLVLRLRRWLRGCDGNVKDVHGPRGKKLNGTAGGVRNGD